MEVRHNCGLCVAHTLHTAYSLISSLQHRGREATGMAAIGDQIDVVKWKGPVKTFDLKDLHKIFDGSKYHTFMAHVRYATKGKDDRILEEAHPHTIGGTADYRGDHIFVFDCDAAIVHNGQVSLEDALAGNDTEALLEYYWKTGEQAILENILGSYTLAIADKRKKDVIVTRDRHGIRPGVVGWKDGKHLFASEEIALRKNGATLIEDMKPGWIYYLKPEGNYEQVRVEEGHPRNHCFFEWNYISAVESVLNGVSVQKVRRMLGEMLWEEHAPEDVDIVSFLPRCPEDAARAYAEKAGLPFGPIFYKKKAERAFQGTTADERASSIKNNLHLLPETGRSSLLSSLEGKVVYLIDDSTIRGNNAKHAIGLLNEAGVKKIYVSNYTPKIGIIGRDGKKRGCEDGVDMPIDDNFIARDGNRNRSDMSINRELGAEIYFMSLDGMKKAFEKAGIPPENICTFCIGGPRPYER